jgi:hypothetical protein
MQKPGRSLMFPVGYHARKVPGLGCISGAA